jgi:hypothetical protein
VDHGVSGDYRRIDRRLMEDEFAEHSIKPICNTAIKEVQPGKMLLEDGQEVPFRYSMLPVWMPWREHQACAIPKDS